VTTFELLLVAHLIGDWLLQTEWMVLNKRSSWSALAAHLAVYHALVLGVLLPRYGIGDARVYAVVAGLLLSHAILDRYWPVTGLMRALRMTVTRPPERWFEVAVDQVVHILLLAAAAAVLG
jgi:hypothetical protein